MLPDNAFYHRNKMIKLLLNNKARTCLFVVTLFLASTTCLYYTYLYSAQIVRLHLDIPPAVVLNQSPQCRQVIGAKKSLSYEKSANFNNLAPLDDFSNYPCVSGLSRTTMENHQVKCVRTICDTEQRIHSTKGCVPLKTLRGVTPICTHPVHLDWYVSDSLRKLGTWEGPAVDNLARYFIAQPDLIFLDLGSNIGTYTLSMAHIGVQVFAVDPVIENLKLLLLSLSLGHFQDNVTLLWNAVANKHTVVKLKKQEGVENVGGTEIAAANLSKSVQAKDYLASTITLDDLLEFFKGKRVGIKMDIENSEYLAVLGGNKFFQEVDVVVLQMEWYYHKTHPDGIKMKNYLSSKGLQPFEDLYGKLPLESVDVSKWPDDVYFMKK